VNNGFKGSAVISATFWEHDVFDPDGKFVRNLVGLGAVMVERTGTRLGEDIPGDEAAGDRGIPFAAAELGKNWCPGGERPICPGQPIIITETIIEDFNFRGENLTRVVVPEETAPYYGETAITISGIPANCKVTDVNAAVNETDTWADQLGLHVYRVELTKGTTNLLFDGSTWPGFCFPVNVDVVMDDDAPTRLADNTDCTEPYGLGQPFKTDAGGLDAFDDALAAGDWTLRVTDTFGGFGFFFGDGTLNSWSLSGTCQTITRRKIFTP
jgi:hypothetical protein